MRATRPGNGRVSHPLQTCQTKKKNRALLIPFAFQRHSLPYISRDSFVPFHFLARRFYLTTKIYFNIQYIHAKYFN